MPASGPVYQPTTVSYDDRNQWASPAGFLAHSGSITRARCLQWLILALGLIGVAAGLVMIIEGGVDLEDTREHAAEIGSTTEIEKQEYKSDVVVIVIGVLLIFIGIALLGFYLILAFRRRVCPCLLTKEQRMARALRSQQSVNGQRMNPSTDLLVAAQYAPVSEIAYHPPAVSEEEETRKLMGSDNKDCILKESDSVITLNEERFEPKESPPPRRLHKFPLNDLPPHPPMIQDKITTVDEKVPSVPSTPSQPVKRKNSWKSTIQRKASTRSRKAPIAAGEEITPSLRSSWSSVYFNNDQDDSDLEAVSYSSDSV